MSLRGDWHICEFSCWVRCFSSVITHLSHSFSASSPNFVLLSSFVVGFVSFFIPGYCYLYLTPPVNLFLFPSFVSSASLPLTHSQLYSPFLSSFLSYPLSSSLLSLLSLISDPIEDGEGHSDGVLGVEGGRAERAQETVGDWVTGELEGVGKQSQPSCQGTPERPNFAWNLNNL